MNPDAELSINNTEAAGSTAIEGVSSTYQFAGSAFDSSFYRKVQKGFIKIAQKNKKNYLIVDSNKEIKINKRIILDKIDRLIK